MQLQDIGANERFVGWLSRRLKAEVAVASVSRPATGGGWSNETAIVELSGARRMRVVVRVQPDGPAMFRDYDLTREYRLLETLGRLGRPPVPEVIGIDAEGSILGRPLFVMHHVQGQIPSDDRPSFAEAGWLQEATAAQQRAFCTSLITAIADIHAVDWRELGLGFLARDADAPLRAEIEWLRDLHRWGAGSELHPTIERGFAAVLERLPAATPVGLLWGDARPANVIAIDFKPVALLDWELVSVGPPELDIAWFLELNRMRTVGSGVPNLPGFLSDEEVVREYERVSDRRLMHMSWHRLFAALKMAVLMERYLRTGIARGSLRPGLRLLTENVALRRLVSLLSD
jgi:aminoglycoside phosphotransferase (APT) family kinase protein